MASLNAAELLMGVILLLQALAAAMWGLGARMKAVPTVPAWHWVGAAGFAVAVMALSLLGRGVGSWLSHGLSNMIAPGSFILLRLGLNILLRAERADGEHLMVIVVAVCCGLVGVSQGAPWLWGVAYSSLLNAYCLLRSAQAVQAHGPLEIGRGAAQVLAATLLGLALLFLSRALLALTLPQQSARPISDPTEANLILLTVLLLLGLLVHLVLGMAVTLRLVRRLHELSRRDALTGLPNRRAADELLDGLLARQRDLGSPFALLLVDADHFKRVNDSQGHAIGDRALVHLGALLQRHARSVDLVARFGGEEFVLLLPDCDHDTALQVAERLRQEVQDEPLRLGGRKLALSVSVGVALGQAGESSAALLVRADRALYRAKNRGRNRVEFEA